MALFKRGALGPKVAQDDVFLFSDSGQAKKSCGAAQAAG
ncbi:Hypothetical protein Cp262_1836 [Corynebacterium pseudotuberculosis]|nr:Hypothetical protein Cp262_1836 [Corynebacterium pseudotuberculosis]